MSSLRRGPLLRQSLLISACLAVTACAGIPDAGQAPAITTPQAFIAEHDAQAMAESDWVQAFNDPVLAALVEEALMNNPGLQRAAAAREAAEAGAVIAGANRFPSLDASIGGSATDAGAGTIESYSAGLDISWQADVWQRVSDQARAGYFSAEAAESDYRSARLSLAGSVARTYFILLENRLQRELREREVDNRERQLVIIERRFERGLSRSSDVRTGRSALASAESNLLQAKRIEASAARTLETLLGRYPSNDIDRVADIPTPDALPGVGTPEMILAQRPDVLAAEYRLASAGFSASAARKALLPGLRLNGSLSNNAADIADIFDTDTLIEMVSASLVAPIFRGGSLRAQSRQARAQADQAAASYVETALNALNEAEGAIFNDELLAGGVSTLEVSRNEAAGALELVERQYANGVATVFELLDAQNRLTTAESQLLSARRQRAENRVDLHLAIAGDFTAGGGISGD